MNFILEAIKAAHFIFLYIFFLIFSLWIREEFATIFKRKSFISFRSLKITIVRVLLQRNGLGKLGTRRMFQNIFLLALTVAPAFYFPLSDRFEFMKQETLLGIINTENSLTYVFFLLTLAEVIKCLINKEVSGLYKRVPALIIVYYSLLIISPTLSLEQMVQYQKSYSDYGLRNYLLINNPVGAAFLAYLIIDELSNPKDEFELIDHMSLNGYILLFIFCFLGGYGLPSIIESQNITPGVFTLSMQTISLCAKFSFSIIIFWVFRFSSIKSERRIDSSA